MVRNTINNNGSVHSGLAPDKKRHSLPLWLIWGFALALLHFLFAALLTGYLASKPELGFGAFDTIVALFWILNILDVLVLLPFAAFNALFPSLIVNSTLVLLILGTLQWFLIGGFIGWLIQRRRVAMNGSRAAAKK